MADHRTWLGRYGGNLGGAVYALACATEFSTLISQNITSSVLMAFSFTSYILFGHKNKGVMASALFNLAGTLAGIVNEMANLSPLSVVGAGLVCVGLGLVAASEPLTRWFGSSENWFLRTFIGQPRKWGSYLAAISNAFIVPDKLIEGHFREGIYYTLLSVGDLLISKSRPQLSL